MTGHNEQDGQCSLYKKKANAASGSCQPLSLCCTIYKSFAYGAGLQMQYHTESQTNMQRMTHARSHLHLGVKVAHVRGKYLTALSFHCCKESMHLARSSAAGWQCLLMYCGGMECLCLPVQASTASTAHKVVPHAQEICCCAVPIIDKHQGLAYRAINAWDLTFGRTQLAHHAPGGHSLQMLTDHLRTPVTDQQNHG